MVVAYDFIPSSRQSVKYRPEDSYINTMTCNQSFEGHGNEEDRKRPRREKKRADRHR